MELSTAMRLGAMATAPTTNGLSFDYDHGRICASCAVGAAAFAVGQIVAKQFSWGFVTGDFGPLAKQFPLLNHHVAAPLCCRTGGTVGQIASDLYESGRWTREQIADWVETIERAQEQPEALAGVEPRRGGDRIDVPLR